MRLSELQEEVAKDLKLDRTDLDVESIRTPEIHNKYFKEYTNHSLALHKLEIELKALVKEKWEYYSGNADPSVYKEKPFDLKVLRQDVSMYIEADPEVQQTKLVIAGRRATVEFLEGVIKQINNRNWIIRNAIEFLKFKQGL